MQREPFSPWEPLIDAPHPQPTAPRPTMGSVLVRGTGLGIIAALMLVCLAAIGVLGVYAYYARSLPSPEELYARTTPFKSTKIYDRHGRLLFEVFDPTGGRRTPVRYGDLPAVLIEATVATEDATFFSNPGFNPLAIARALYQDVRYGELAIGASTITQQLVKNLFLTPERTLERKVKEALLAAELTRRYSKTEILAIYLNEVYFGNLAYGVGAAAETYFGKSVNALTLPEAALLVGMIQSPAIYDPYTNPEGALARRQTVLRLMRERGYISLAEFEGASEVPLQIVPHALRMEAPHMVMYVREQLEKLYGTEMLYKGGLQVYTTLDLDLQHLAEAVAQEKIAALREQNASNAAVVALDPKTGDILALLGSVNFYDRELGGQVNVARMPRQPGSTIKPFTYLAALERGWTAATMLMDVAQEFPDGVNPPYKPQNYDDKEYGPLSLRTALACSRNIPAVWTLQQIGLPALLEVTRRLGIQSLTRPDYGLALTLGGGEVTLLEMTGAYAALANGGRRVAPRTILRIADQDGRVILDPSTPDLPQVVDARHAHLLSDILADDRARQPSFGPNSPLKLSFPAAAKSGTTNDYRDSWTVGYTPSFVTGVWVGNNDNRTMQRLSGSRGAALIWHDFMEHALAGKPQPTFSRPQGIVELEVCPVSGHKRGENCPPARKEIFVSEHVPQGECPVHRQVAICQASGQMATAFCPGGNVEQKRFEDYGPTWDAWARQRGLAIPPRETCALHAVPMRVTLEVPAGRLAGVIEVRGSTEVAEFAHYVVEYGFGAQPAGWTRLTPEIKSPVNDGLLCRWDTLRLPDGVYSLRVVVSDRRGNRYMAGAVTEIRNAAPTSPPTRAPVPTFTLVAPTRQSPTPVLPTLTALPTRTNSPTPIWPTFTATPSRTSSPTAIPTFTPVPSATLWPSTTPSPAPTSQPSPSTTPTLVPKPLNVPSATPSPSASPVPKPSASPDILPTQAAPKVTHAPPPGR